MAHTKPSTIINNLELVFKTNDIEKLSKPAYDFVMNVSGFIAHYDLYGFRHEYQDVSKLLTELQSSRDISDKERYITDRFFTDENKMIAGVSYKDYYRSKYETLAGIETLCHKYSVQTQKHQNSVQDYQWSVLLETVERAKTDTELQRQLTAALFN